MANLPVWCSWCQGGLLAVIHYLLSSFLSFSSYRFLLSIGSWCDHLIFSLSNSLHLFTSWCKAVMSTHINGFTNSSYLPVGVLSGFFGPWHKGKHGHTNGPGIKHEIDMKRKLSYLCGWTRARFCLSWQAAHMHQCKARLGFSWQPYQEFFFLLICSSLTAFFFRCHKDLVLIILAGQKLLFTDQFSNGW